jgi:hypothetical protein
MKKIFQTLTLTLILSVTSLSAYAGVVGTLYIKNNSNSTVYVWVDGVMQGYVPAGKTGYMVKDGFVTHDSTLDNIKESHGGWHSNGEIKVDLRGHIGENKPLYSSLTIDGGQDKTAQIWFGEDDAGAEMTAEDIESAGQILKGNAKPLSTLPGGEEYVTNLSSRGESALFTMALVRVSGADLNNVFGGDGSDNRLARVIIIFRPGETSSSWNPLIYLTENVKEPGTFRVAPGNTNMRVETDGSIRFSSTGVGLSGVRKQVGRSYETTFNETGTGMRSLSISKAKGSPELHRISQDAILRVLQDYENAGSSFRVHIRDLLKK